MAILSSQRHADHDDRAHSIVHREASGLRHLEIVGLQQKPLSGPVHDREYAVHSDEQLVTYHIEQQQHSLCHASANAINKLDWVFLTQCVSSISRPEAKAA